MALSPSDLEKLKDVDVRLAALCRRVASYDIPFKVLTGHRNEADQNKAFAEGKSQKRWPDGEHNALPSKAIDVVPIYVDITTKIDWNDAYAVCRLAGFFEATAYAMGFRVRLGMDWNGNWRTAGKGDPKERFFDAYHIEILD
jgi:peptidoglycan L-alanyl-D-glutamate endopeptidase CwlK